MKGSGPNELACSAHPAAQPSKKIHISLSILDSLELRGTSGVPGKDCYLLSERRT